jgi:hypothetical protein
MVLDKSDESVKEAAAHLPTNDIPEGKILDHVELHCDKHDDITKGSIFLSYTTQTKEGKTIQHQNFFCVQCLTELINEFAEQGKIGKLQMVRVFRDKTEEELSAKTEAQPELPPPEKAQE